MRAFTVTERGAAKGLGVCSAPFAHVALGEEGRGRTLTRIAVTAATAVVDDEAVVLDASPVEEQARGRTHVCLVSASGSENDALDALVKLAIPAGFRGDGVTWTSAQGGLESCPERGQAVSYFSAVATNGGTAWECRSCGTVFPYKEGEYRDIHPDAGEWFRFAPLESVVRVLARGHCAQGEAGNAGGHDELLVVIPNGGALRAYRSGRLYGEPAELWLLWTGVDLVFGIEDEVFPPA
jgi:hypothetical protein